ncbi:MAG: polysaccharide pyruvyl transferase family protein [Steroidobacteraceae bacterium]
MPRLGARILLLGGDADHNVGDCAILTALSHCIVAHDASAGIAIVGDPTVHSAIPGVAQVIPGGLRGIAELTRAACKADRILVAGGGLFQDDDSRAKMPYWAARISLLKACNGHIAGFSIGAGPLTHVESRAAARMACAALTRISVRDRFARDALAACTSRPIGIVPDPAFMLEPAPRDAATAFLKRLDLPAERPLLFVAVRRWFHERGGFVPNGLKAGLGIEPKRDPARFEAMQSAVAEAVKVVAHRLDANILLLPTYNVAREGDDFACEALMWRMPGVTARLARIADPRLYKAVLGHASLVIAARMHPLILAAGMGVPFVGLSYNPKFDGLYDLLGLSSRSLPLDHCPEIWGASTLVAAAESVLDARIDLRHRAESIASTVRLQTLEAVFGSAAGRVLETADA